MNCRTFEVCIPSDAETHISYTDGNEKSLANAANLSHDHFIRTTDPEHREAVQYFWVCRAIDPAELGQPNE
jgi:hypothetical protein